MNELYQFDEEYRDSIATVDASGKRIWVYPKKPSGHFHNLRIVVAVLLLALLFGMPFIKVDGSPLILIDVFERNFIIFGIHLWPQDFHIVALSMISLVVFIVLFTVVFGRVWCGWTCPQTIFMEMVFRKIEYLIEGDGNKQRKLDGAPWNTEKILKKGSKHLIFILISLLISHTFLSYIIGIEKLQAIVSQPPGENLIGFIALMVFTGLFYGVLPFCASKFASLFVLTAGCRVYFLAITVLP
jgi:polyferredoxin